jgi:hypothetical protein
MRKKFPGRFPIPEQLPMANYTNYFSFTFQELYDKPLVAAQATSIPQ